MEFFALVLVALVGALCLVGFAAMGIDKRAARRAHARVPERTLLLVAALGGSPGIATGILVWRHKTRKAGFLVPFGLILLLQGALVAWLLQR